MIINVQLGDKIKYKGTWSSLVYGTRLENENFKKVVSSNLTVPVNYFTCIYKYIYKKYSNVKPI